MNGHTYGLQWIAADLSGHGQFIIEQDRSRGAEAIITSDQVDSSHGYLLSNDEDVASESNLAHIAAENLILMARDGQMMSQLINSPESNREALAVSASDCVVMQQAVQITIDNELVNGYVEEVNEEEYGDNSPQMVTEEVITDDWVQHQGEERVEISADQIVSATSQMLLDTDVALPTDQDEYTALRPYPCDFCSRRFRKKMTLLNHIVTHQHDRQNICKLCDSRFSRRSDLLKHLKAHAMEPEQCTEQPGHGNNDFFEGSPPQAPKGAQTLKDDNTYENYWSMDLVRSSADSQKSSHSTQEASDQSSRSSSTVKTTGTSRGRLRRLKIKDVSYAINLKAEGFALDNSKSYNLCKEQNTENTVPSASQSKEEKQSFPVIDESKPFVCQQCGLAFAREKALLSHDKNHRDNAPFECQHCNEMFWDMPSLHDHQKVHQFEESNSEYDPDEAEQTPSESESDNLYGEFYCCECGISFHRRDLLKRHSRQHAKAEIVSNELGSQGDGHCCSTCGETFAEALDLLAHAEVHARYAPYKCVLCGESFFEEGTIRRHLQTLHATEMMDNSCILCGKACRDRKALIKHAWDHSRAKSHSCSKCGKNFHNKARLKRHMMSHRDKSVKCEVCQKEFPDGRTLSNHRHSHNVTSSGKMFPCNECGKTFGSRSSQQIHVRIHTGERPYGCRYCWKAFADGGTLRKHERIHTGEKPYACSVCPRAFNQRVVLREHIRSHHSGLDEKRGSYFCNVCSSDQSSSSELIQHLVKHSDANTAKQRQPVPGPRKYKRRRKLKPHEIASLREGGDEDCSDIDVVSDLDMDDVSDLLGFPETSSPDNSNNSSTMQNKMRAGTLDSSRQKSKKRVSSTNTIGVIPSTTVMGNEDENIIDQKQGRLENSSKLWQTKLINSSYNEALISNVESTLESIDVLVVDNNRNHTTSKKDVEEDETPVVSKVRSPKATGKSMKSARFNMIPTDKRAGSHLNEKKRAKNHTIRTQKCSLDLLQKSPTTNIVDDYEIISPNAIPPNQISSSPLHIKQEQEQNSPQQLTQRKQLASNGDLYNTQLLLEASALRKQALEKYNPTVMNDLEDILRSPVKSDMQGRQRFNSESSIVYINEQAVEYQHLIKIEPTSPDLHDIVTTSVANNSPSYDSNGKTNAGRTSRRTTRATRSFLITSTSVNQQSPIKHKDRTTKRISSRMEAAMFKRNSSEQHLARNKTTPIAHSTTAAPKNPSSSTSSAFLDYSASSYNGMSSSSNIANVNSAFSSISAVVSAANAVESSAQATPARRLRYFECEMCSAVFGDRAQLLDHVPIHI